MEELSDKIRELVYKDNAAELDKILEKHSYFAFRDFLSKGFAAICRRGECVKYLQAAAFKRYFS